MNTRTKATRQPSRKVQTAEPIQASGGNVFTDLGFADADERMAKAELARQIGHLIEVAGLSQTGRSHPFAGSRTSAVVSPASLSGVRTACSPAAFIPGRWSPRSSRFAPFAMTSKPIRSRSFSIRSYSSVLQK